MSRIYCGENKDLPDGYNRFGSRFECLRKGYGIAMYKAPMTKIIEARKKKGITDNDVFAIANQLDIPIITNNGNSRKKDSIIKDIILKLEKITKIKRD